VADQGATQKYFSRSRSVIIFLIVQKILIILFQLFPDFQMPIIWSLNDA